MRTDRDIATEVLDEWLCGAGIRMDVRLVARFLGRLIDGYGKNFDLELACMGMDNMANTAKLMAEQMRETKEKEKVSEE